MPRMFSDGTALVTYSTGKSVPVAREVEAAQHNGLDLRVLGVRQILLRTCECRSVLKPGWVLRLQADSVLPCELVECSRYPCPELRLARLPPFLRRIRTRVVKL